ncbi:VOC family protein [Salinisphaera sp. Q1T1-3]|uniref:2-oxoadipate dioxygenase/decarboxylase HglS n=1 Tax=Salinisphaera sp. Q1T1-3 TaxID=2321229 RepID=UPI000E707757|nr:VOC family protein [Salinisphaera sp. Q1T1-3]RJS91830.1 VOC family protein [Salinisphaera sp. Q1T1-3]
MASSEFVSCATIRSRFAAAMSAMYQAEVPQYETLTRLVAAVNDDVLAARPALRDQLAAADDLERLSVERHGAIRVGTAAELNMLARMFAIMGMAPVGYYDLAAAGVPVHATAFRPTETEALAINPFRVFTSLLRLDLITDDGLRAQAESILAERDIFTSRLRDLVAHHDTVGGFDEAEAQAFVTEALETFRWHDNATVDHATYTRLAAQHRLIADVVCFRGPHINHLTPRTLDIDTAQSAMPDYGITPKAVIEGPPQREVPILLRQTSFKALEEDIRFAGDTIGHHTARFGEIEQRGVALTPDGRTLYDRLLAAAKTYKHDNNDDYQAALAGIFAEFPDDLETLRRRELAYFRYEAVGESSINADSPTDDDSALEALLASGVIVAHPIVYEDFLPVSAACIFQSNLGDAPDSTQAAAASQQTLEVALGRAVIDPFALYAEIEAESKRAALVQVMGTVVPSGA